jgi:hypothetical protein
VPFPSNVLHSTADERIRVASSTTSAVVRDGYVAAKSAAVAYAPSNTSKTASRLPRSSSTAVMLSAHCSEVGTAPGATGSDALDRVYYGDEGESADSRFVRGLVNHQVRE